MQNHFALYLSFALSAFLSFFILSLLHFVFLFFVLFAFNCPLCMYSIHTSSVIHLKNQSQIGIHGFPLKFNSCNIHCSLSIFYHSESKFFDNRLIVNINDYFSDCITFILAKLWVGLLRIGFLFEITSKNNVRTSDLY